MQEIIKLENVSHRYKEVDEQGNAYVSERGVNNIDLSIYEGEFVALVGHNGSGKSTLAKLLNGLILPTNDGTVTVDRMSTKVSRNLYNIRKIVGVVFQNPDNQMIASIVEDDIAFGPENIGLPSAEISPRVDWALEKVGMGDFRRRTTHKLSGGQKQRIAIAGILAIKPRVMVLDESTAMLDPNGRAEVLDTITKLNKEEKITIVLITHYMEEALRADRVVVMQNSKIILNDTPQKVFIDNSNKLIEAGLDIPVSLALSRKLNEGGLNVGDNLNLKQLGDKICRLL